MFKFRWTSAEVGGIFFLIAGLGTAGFRNVVVIALEDEGDGTMVFDDVGDGTIGLDGTGDLAIGLYDVGVIE
jgi:hypothetical protein